MHVRQPPWAVGLTTIVVLATYTSYRPRPRPYASLTNLCPTVNPDQDLLNVTDLTAGNSTLGFQTILVLSTDTDPRVDGLRAAAKASGINLQISGQAPWNEMIIQMFGKLGQPKERDAVLVWLAQIDLLRSIIQNRWGSALVLEDHVDWSLDIRDQTLRAAAAVLNLTQQTQKDQNPYGTLWDLLWMGHCSETATESRPRVIYDDATFLSSKDFETRYRDVSRIVKGGQRYAQLFESASCTYAYAVSARGVEKLLEYASKGLGESYDVMLSQACANKVIDCITVGPSLFEAYQPAPKDSDNLFKAAVVAATK